MATPKKQRIAILVIAAVMLVGTIGSFVAMILATDNQQADQQRQQELYAKWEKDHAAYEKKKDAQAKDLSKKYYPILAQYKDKPAPFDRNGVKKLETQDLKKGTGSVVNEESDISFYYIGWDPEGRVFDQSINGNTLKTPLNTATGMIAGMIEGMKGMKLGGVRLITIPSEKAYGETGSTDASGKETIAPNTPLKFIVLAIEKPQEIKEPVIPTELYGGY